MSDRNDRQETLPGIGPVKVRRQIRSRRISIRVTSAGEVVVTLPWFVSWAQARRFVMEKQEWVYRALERYRTMPRLDEAERLRKVAELRKSAKAYIPERLTRLAEQKGVVFQGVTIKDMTSRWGSCSATNHINISLYVMRLPAYLTDYVLLHELAHTVYKHHDADFYRLLDRWTDGHHAAWRREMKKFACGC